MQANNIIYNFIFTISGRRKKKTNNHTINNKKSSLTSEKLSSPYHQMTVTVTIIINKLYREDRYNKWNYIYISQ